jgi:hypothetical protein
MSAAKYNAKTQLPGGMESAVSEMVYVEALREATEEISWLSAPLFDPTHPKAFIAHPFAARGELFLTR